MSNWPIRAPWLLLGLIATLSAIAAPQPPASIPADWFRPNAPLAEGDGTAGFVVDPSQRETSRLFYQSVFMASENLETGWTGDLNGCVPGTLSADYQDATILRVNWFRAMAGVPANIVLDSDFSDKAQQAALMMAANGQLSHTPPSSWSCYTSDGAEAAGNSNLSLGNAGPDAIFSQMRDDGTNNAAVGHRRWILHPQTARMGAGSLPGTAGHWASNALWVFDDNLWAARPAVRDGFIAWPPPGYMPYQSVFARWSFSYDDADFSTAGVTMTRDGSPVALTLEALSYRAGENTLVWLPAPYQEGDAWARPTADETYQVTVSNVLLDGARLAFTYQVTVFDPSEKGLDYVPQSLIGPEALSVGATAFFEFTPVAVADRYQWRVSMATDYTTIGDAESGLGDWLAATSPEYAVISNERAASGVASFHLAHPQPMDEQTLTFNRSLLPAADAQLWFSSWLGWATEQQVATVEISEDGGQSWVAIWEQPGTQQPPASAAFESVTVPLGDYADRSVSLRFNYRYLGGTYYPQTTADVGWFIDDVELSGVATLNLEAIQATDTDSRFAYTPSAAGTVLLQVRPLLFGSYPGEWSPVKQIAVTAGASECSTLAETLASLNLDNGHHVYRSEISLDIQGTIQVGGEAFLLLAAPTIRFQPGFRIEAGGRLSATAQAVSCDALSRAQSSVYVD
ncbi:hypothetical protein GJ668_16540 [Allochromatium palmeri]|uniref:SCP domain-containing protein n=2 Tax=Allochromatium palmeri TaxID=231048 RepID=A0A6N8EIZ1_9GAMM|nr:hypothetical protein [Allochromatium palmeri]